MTRLFLNAMGIVNPLGDGKGAVADGLLAGTRALTPDDALIPGRTVPVGAVTAALPAIAPDLGHFDCRNNRLALAAMLQIEDAVREAVAKFGADRIAVIMGTSTSGIGEGEQGLAERRRTGAWPPGYDYRRQEPGNLADFVACRFGLSGPAYTIGTACSSSAKVFASARRLIRLGLCDAAVVGGADSLCRLTANGFAALEALSSRPCDPFSLGRDGINIGEGAAVFLMSSEPAEIELLGIGESSDASHVSAPDPSGAGAAASMRLALDDCGLAPAEIDYLNLHGTATPLNDAMESRAVAEVFPAGLPCSSTKALTGHLLGAAGATEAAFLWLLLHRDWSDGRLPPHRWDGRADPALPRLDLVAAGTRLPQGRPVAAMSNSFAFGGSNVSLILGRGWDR